MIETFDLEKFQEALQARDTERVHGWIEVAPLEARAELQRVLDFARAHEDQREVQLQQLRAASFAGEIDRGVFEQAALDHAEWKRGNVGFQRVVGRYVQHAQTVHARQKRERHEALHGTQLEMESTGPWVRLKAVEAELVELRARLERLEAER